MGGKLHCWLALKYRNMAVISKVGGDKQKWGEQKKNIKMKELTINTMCILLFKLCEHLAVMVPEADT